MPTALSLLVFCLALGMLTARVARPPEALARSLNWWVINIALPALVLHLIPHVHLDRQLWFLIASMWLVFLGAWVLFAFLGKRFGWSRGRIGALTLTCGLGNTSFVGYPMMEALRGQEALGLAVIADQVGCFAALTIGGVAVTAVYAGQRLHPVQVLQRMIFFPPFIALLIGLLAGADGGFPPLPDAVFGRIGQTLTPLALFSVGLQLHFGLDRGQIGAAAFGLGWKLLLAPVLCYAVGAATGVGGSILVVGVLQAAMPPMISAAILAEQHGLEPRLANTTLGVGILLGLVTVPFASTLL